MSHTTREWEMSYGFALSIIACKKFAGIATHVGILLPDGTVAHCSPGKGPRITSSEEFSGGQEIRVVRPVPPALVPEALNRLRQALAEARPYDILNWNCETFLNWVIYGDPVSHQIGNAIGAIAIGTIAGLCITALTASDAPAHS